MTVGERGGSGGGAAVERGVGWGGQDTSQECIFSMVSSTHREVSRKADPLWSSGCGSIPYA